VDEKYVVAVGGNFYDVPVGHGNGTTSTTSQMYAVTDGTESGGGNPIAMNLPNSGGGGRQNLGAVRELLQPEPMYEPNIITVATPDYASADSFG
jgi:hypothetical protein